MDDDTAGVLFCRLKSRNCFVQTTYEILSVSFDYFTVLCCRYIMGKGKLKKSAFRFRNSNSLRARWKVVKNEFMNNRCAGKSVRNILDKFKTNYFLIETGDTCGTSETSELSETGELSETSELREAIPYQIGCFFTHCVNGPWPIVPPLDFTQSCCELF